MRFIDTNILIRHFTGDDEVKARKVAGLLKKVEADEEKVTASPFVVFEIIYTLERIYNLPKEKIKDLVSFFLSLKGLKFPEKELYLQSLDIYVGKNISFADAFNAAFIIKNEIKEIYSYDEDFDKIKEVKRIVP